LRARRAKRYSIIGERPSKAELAAIDAELRELTHPQDDALEDIESARLALPAMEERLDKSSEALTTACGAEARARYAVVHGAVDALMGEAADKFEEAYRLYCEASLMSFRATEVSHAIGGQNALGIPTCANGLAGGMSFRGAFPIAAPISTIWPSPRFPGGRMDLQATPALIDAAEKSVDEILAALERETAPKPK
jgi:hypothetical protein